MRRVLARWQRSGLTLREFGQQRGIPLSTLTWWCQVFRRAGEPVNVAAKSGSGGDAVVFTEVPRPATIPAGYLQVDAAPAYDDVFAQYPEIIEVGCWAHARRYFKEAMPTAAVTCAQVLALIGQLYGPTSQEGRGPTLFPTDQDAQAAGGHARCEGGWPGSIRTLNENKQEVIVGAGMWVD